MAIHPTDTIYLKNFISHLDELHNAFPDCLLKDQIEELRNFYSNSKQANSTLTTHLQTCKDELAFIYRMRNKIAHDGDSEHPLLPFLCDIASKYALLFFNEVCKKSLDKNKLHDLRSVLISAVQDFDFIEMRLQSETPKAVFLSE